MTRAMSSALLAAVLASGAPHAAARAADTAAAQAEPAKSAAPAPGSAQAGTAAPRKSAAPAHGAAPRTLDDIRIEGEIPVPQVLFITARDQRRFMDLHHRRYLKSSLEIGERIAFPAALTVVHTPATGTGKEQSP
jgi:hypothetical protein